MPDRHLEGVHRAPVFGRAALGLRDVDPVLGERLGDGGQEPGAVGAGDLDRDRTEGLGLVVPGDIDPAQRIEVERLRALARVDGDAVTAADEADDGVAGDRGAALGELHQDVRLALHLDPGDRALADGAAGGRRGLGGRGRRGRGTRPEASTRIASAACAGVTLP